MNLNQVFAPRLPGVGPYMAGRFALCSMLFALCSLLYALCSWFLVLGSWFYITCYAHQYPQKEPSSYR